LIAARRENVREDLITEENESKDTTLRPA
jgi:hypothetical protein